MRTKPELDPSPSLSPLTQTDYLVKLDTPVSQARHTNQAAVVDPPCQARHTNLEQESPRPLARSPSSGFVPNSNVIIEQIGRGV